MNNFARIKVDTKKEKLFFKGNCLEVLDLCEAMCCKKTNVTLTSEEIRSNFYKAEAFCVINNKKCKDKKIECVNREYRLERKKDSSCVYLTPDNKCSIHEEKPQNCRDFDCGGGWRLHFSPEQLDGKPEVKKRRDEYFMESLRDSMIFVLNPLVKVKTLFYVKEKKEIVFVNKRINKCSFASSRYKFHSPGMDDENLFYLIGLFDGKNTLRDVREKLNKKYGLELPQNDLYKIVCFLRNNNIIIFKNPIDSLPRFKSP